MADESRPRIALTTLLLSDYALTAQDGKISAIGLFSQINIARLPAVHGRLFIVAVLEADAGVYELQLQVLAPSGESVLDQSPRLKISVPPNATTANVVANLNGMKLSELGRHRIELRNGDQLLGSTPFNVNLVLRSRQVASA
jgi:hypothetical protein